MRPLWKGAISFGLVNIPVGLYSATQSGREVKGEMADYFPRPGKFVVTGNPARISDPGKGKSAARRLTFFTTDDRILLENT